MKPVGEAVSKLVWDQVQDATLDDVDSRLSSLVWRRVHMAVRPRVAHETFRLRFNPHASESGEGPDS